MSCSTKHLPVAVHAGPDADGGNRDRLGHAPGDRRRHQLQHHGAGASLGERLGVLDQPVGRGGVAALDLVAAEGVHRLGGEPEVSHHRNASLHQRAHRLDHVAPALELHTRRVGLLQHASRVPDRLGDRHLIGEERHVHEQQRGGRAAANRGRVIDHLVERGAERGLLPGDHLVEGVAHEQHVHLRALQEPREGRVVAGQHHQPASLGLRGGEVEDVSGARVSGHGPPARPALASRSRGGTARDGE